MTNYFQRNVEFECVIYKFELNVYNDCGEIGNCLFELKSACAAYDIDYCDYMPFCGSANQNFTNIPANFECSDCKYNWTPSKYFQGTDQQKSPTIYNSMWSDALNRDYFVAVTTKEGCMFFDTVRVREKGFHVKVDTIIGTCNIEVTITINFEFPAGNSLIDLSVFDNINSVSYNPVFQFGQSSDRVKVYKVIVSRGFTYGPELSYEVEVNFPTDNYCQIGESCRMQGYIGKFGANIFPNAWYAYIPNVFSPNGDGINDTFSPFFSTYTDGVNCNKRYSGSSIYWAELKIFDRWGEELFYSQTAIKDPNALVGLTGAELSWDGKFKGKLMDPGVYVWTLEVHSCTTIAPCAGVNCLQSDGEFCSYFGDNNRLLKGSITIIQ